MKATGIIAEFNPLHNGHVHLIREARRLTGNDAVVVVMSGNYVQRGEPSIYDKRIRTWAAITEGADLVIELQAAYSLGNAGQFAAAGVAMLESLGCTNHIAFGSESGDIEKLTFQAEFIKNNIEALNERIAEFTGKGFSYPVARAASYSELVNELNSKNLSDNLTLIPTMPNDTLALEYLIAADTLKPICVKRKGAGYNEDIDKTSEFQSASGLRKLIGEINHPNCEELSEKISEVEKFVPCSILDIIKNEKLSNREIWTTLLKYELLKKSASEIDNCPSGGEGMGYLIKRAGRECSSMDDIIKFCKSKKYTYTRIARLTMQIILGIERTLPDSRPEYIRILGFNDRGREILSYIKKNKLNKVPLITNTNKEQPVEGSQGNIIMRLENNATDIYNLALGRDMKEYSDSNLHPVVI